ncbi:MAG: peptidylprolyl isomerase [Longimicrobiales bacterium]
MTANSANSVNSLHHSRPLATAFALLLASLVGVQACAPGDLASAADHRLTIDQAAELVADHSQIPIDTQVVRAVAELWVDYVLLADQIWQDTTLASLDVDPAISQSVEELMLSRLQDAVIEVDTVISEEELRTRFAADMPGARATASHILLAFPPDPTQEQRDSVAAHAAAVRQDLLQGGDFAQVAAQQSGDPGTARAGGSLGTFDRGSMLAPIDEAVFSLSPGEISEPVESHLGFHLVRTDSHEFQDFEVGREAFRAQLINERRGAAQDAYVTELEAAAGLSVPEGAVDIARALALAPLTTVSVRAGERPLVTFEGGTYTADDFQQVAENSGPAFSQVVGTGTDEVVTNLLMGLGRQHLLVEEARSLGHSPSETEADSISAEARGLIIERAKGLGLYPATGQPGESGEPGTPTGPAAAAKRALERVVSGTEQVVPLGGITFLLRDAEDWSVVGTAIQATVARALELKDSKESPTG